MPFVLTIEVPATDRPGIHLAQMMREAATVIETQVPMQDHQHVYDRWGVQKYEWAVEEIPPE